MSGAIRIGTNIASLTAQRRLAEATSALSTAYEKLSSGQRINRASDDAAGLAVSMGLRAASAIKTQAIRNVNDAVSAVNIAQGAWQAISDITDRISELAEQSANGVYSAVQRQALDSEGRKLIDEFNRIKSSTNFNGLNLLDASSGQLAVQLDGGGGENLGLSLPALGSIGSDSVTTTPTGTFESPVIYGSAIDSRTFALGEFDGNFGLDLVVGDYGLDRVVLVSGGGDGTFGTGTVVEWLAGSPDDMTAVDLNKDGKVDLAMTLGDINRICIRINNGDGTFTSMTDLRSSDPWGVAAGDFDRDGNIDLATADYIGGNSITVFLGNGDGNFDAPVPYDVVSNGARKIATGYFDNDSNLDVVVTTYLGSKAEVLLGNVDGSFKAPVAYSVGFDAWGVATDDLDTDGDVDIVVAEAAGQGYSVLKNNGDGTFAARVSYTAFGTPSFVRIADVNGDSKPDLIGSERNSGVIGVLLNDGNGTFSTYSTYDSGLADVGAIACADLNGDGALDTVGVDWSGWDGPSVLLGGTTSSTVEGAATLGADIAYFDLSSASGAREALDRAGGLKADITSALAQLGAVQSRLMTAGAVLHSSIENSDAAASRIVDSDVALESAKLIKGQILQNVASAMLSHANRSPEIALTLLRQT